MLDSLLDWLTSSEGGAFIVVAWALSWGFENVAWWRDLDSRIKSLIILGLSALIAIGAVILKNNPALVAAVEPYFRPVYYIVLAWLTTQGAYKTYKALGGTKLFEVGIGDVEDADVTASVAAEIATEDDQA